MADNTLDTEQTLDTTNLLGDISSDISVDTTQPEKIDPPKQSFSDTINSGLQTAFQESYAPTPVSFEDEFFGAKGAKIKYHAPEVVDKYHAQEGFNPRLFDAEDEAQNLERYANNETVGSALAKGFDSFAFNFGNTFTGWFADYPKMVNALFSMDWDEMKPDEENLVNEYYAQQKNMNENYVFAKPGEEDDIFNKKFVSEFIGNAGFALGTTFALGLEFLADAAITTATSGAGFETFFATGARASAKLAAREAAKTATEAAGKSAFSNVFEDVFKGYRAGVEEAADIPRALNIASDASVIKQMEQAEVISAMAKSQGARKTLIKDYANMLSNNIFNIGKSKSVGELAGNIAKGTPLLGTATRFGERIGAAAEAGATMGQLFGIGLQGTRRLAQELNMSASESYFEAISTYGDTLDKMGKQYLLDNQGKAPSFDEFNRMKNLATAASGSNYDTNMGILLVTNHLQFGNLFSKYIPANKVVQDLIGESSERILTVSSKKGLQAVFKKGAVLGTLNTLGKVSAEFGKKEAMYQLGRSAFKNIARFELTEGLQENMQEVSAAGWRDYYSGKFNGTKATLSETMSAGLSSQFTKQGLKTFLMGALTGTLIRVPSKMLNFGLEKANKQFLKAQYSEEGAIDPYTAFEKRLDEDIELLNNFIKKGKNGSFETRLFNFNAQAQSALEQTASASVGAEYSFHNGKDNALLSAISAASRIGTTDAFVESIKNSIGDMTPEQFKKEFGIDIEDTEYASPQQFAAKMAGDVKKYTKTLEEFTRGFKTKLEDPRNFTPETPEYFMANYIRNAQEEALHIAAINSIKASMAVDRATSLANELSASPLLSNSSDLVLRVMTNPVMVISEVGRLKGDIKVAEQSIKLGGLDRAALKALRAEIKSKTNQLDELDKWASFWDTRKAMAEREETDASTDTTPIFVGKRVARDKATGKFTKRKYGEKQDKINFAYNQNHKDVMAVFKKLLIAKNEEAGITTGDIKDTELQDAFTKLVDYMQLDSDTKDYIDAVEVLTNKDRFREITKQMSDGKYKFNLIHYVDTLMNTFQQEAYEISKTIKNINSALEFNDYLNLVKDTQDDIMNNTSYLRLVALISSKEFGMNKRDEAAEYIDEVSKIIKDKFQSFIKTHLSEQISKDITDEDYNKIIATNDLGIVATYHIGDKLFNSRGDKAVLTEREKELYEKFKDEIDTYISDLQTTETAEKNAQQVEPEAELTEEQTPAPVSKKVVNEAGVESDVVNPADEDAPDGPSFAGGLSFGKKKQNTPAAPLETKTGRPNPRKKNEPEDLADYEEEESDTPLTDAEIESLYAEGELDEADYIAYKNTKRVTDRIQAMGVGPMDSMTDTIVEIMSKLQTYADQDKVSFEVYFDNAKNTKLINEVITKAVIEDLNGEEIEDFSIGEVVVTPTNDYDKEELLNLEIPDDIIDDILSSLDTMLADVDSLTTNSVVEDIERRRDQELTTIGEGLTFIPEAGKYAYEGNDGSTKYVKGKDVDKLETLVNAKYDSELQAYIKNSEKSSKNTNFVNEIVTEQTIYDMLKDRKLNC